MSDLTYFARNTKEIDIFCIKCMSMKQLSRPIWPLPMPGVRWKDQGLGRKAHLM